MKIRYTANNSGGQQWLTHDNWKALESAGWEVKWNSYLQTPARHASKEFETARDALLEFERVTGQDVSARGCLCCGPPHQFDWNDDHVAGYGCLDILYDIVPGNLREAVEMLNETPTVGK